MGKMKNSFGGSKAGQEREVAGARKVIFGSDGPWLHPSIELYKIRVLGLSPRDEQLVLGGNILRLIRNVRFPICMICSISSLVSRARTDFAATITASRQRFGEYPDKFFKCV